MNTTTSIVPRNSIKSVPGMAHRLTTYLPPDDIAGNEPPPWKGDIDRIIFGDSWGTHRTTVDIWLYREPIDPAMINETTPDILKDDPHIYWLWHPIPQHHNKGMPSSLCFAKANESRMKEGNFNHKGLDLIIPDAPIESKTKRLRVPITEVHGKKHKRLEWYLNLFQVDLRAHDIKRASEAFPNLKGKIIRKRVNAVIQHGENGYEGAWHQLV